MKRSEVIYKLTEALSEESKEKLLLYAIRYWLMKYSDQNTDCITDEVYALLNEEVEIEG